MRKRKKEQTNIEGKEMRAKSETQSGERETERKTEERERNYERI